MNARAKCKVYISRAWCSHSPKGVYFYAVFLLNSNYWQKFRDLEETAERRRRWSVLSVQCGRSSQSGMWLNIFYYAKMKDNLKNLFCGRRVLFLMSWDHDFFFLAKLLKWVRMGKYVNQNRPWTVITDKTSTVSKDGCYFGWCALSWVFQIQLFVAHLLRSSGGNVAYERNDEEER